MRIFTAWVFRRNGSSSQSGQHREVLGSSGLGLSIQADSSLRVAGWYMVKILVRNASYGRQYLERLAGVKSHGPVFHSL